MDSSIELSRIQAGCLNLSDSKASAMDVSVVRPIVCSNIEAIDQGLNLLQRLTDAQYTAVLSPYVSSSIGQHFRHIVDMFYAITQRTDPCLIDYNRRRRGAAIEASRAVAIEELNEVRDWMESFAILPVQSGSDLLVDIRSEVTLEATCSVVIGSTMLRELIFTSSHAVHHYALISVIAKLQGVALESTLGIAPATATFLREELDRCAARPTCAL